jgi:glycosyltransferase involved in cell wall biosynthesis
VRSFARLSKYFAGRRLIKSMASDPPLVSCVMATTQARRPFLSQAIKYFQRQTYAPKELIVVDDPGGSSSEPPIDMIAPVRESAPAVRYVQTGTKLSLGSKLNLGISEARGMIIQKLDDDDYYHPEFLRTTVGALLAGKRMNSIAACTSHLILFATTQELKVRHLARWSGGTLCFFKELWQECPYRDISLAEDLFFLKDHKFKLIGIDNPELYCYVRHAGGHLWSHFLKSERMELGKVTAGGDVTEYMRRLPAYSKSLKEYIPEEDLWFWDNQLQSAHSSAPHPANLDAHPANSNTRPANSGLPGLALS